jgi:hypothetical protein
VFQNRTFRVVLLCWSAVWFGAVVPGHQRGVIRLSGAAETCSVQRQLPPCHQRKLPKPGSEAPKAPGPGNCAICLHLSTLATPPPIDCGLTYLGPCRAVPAPEPELADSRRIILPFDERGPPLA